MTTSKQPGAYLAPDHIRDIIKYSVMHCILATGTYNIKSVTPIIKVRNYYAFEKESMEAMEVLAFNSGKEYDLRRADIGIENMYDCVDRIVSQIMYHMSITFDSSRTFTECTVDCKIEQFAMLTAMTVVISLW